MSDEERRRRENMMERRLRKARGEEVPDELELYDPYDEEEEERPRSLGGDYQGYGRPAGGYGGRGAGCGNAFLFGALALLAAVLVGALLFNRALGQLAEAVPSIPDVREIIITPTPEIITGAAVIQRVQQLSRLETASYTIQTVIEVNQSQGNPLFDYFAGDALLLIAQGKVVAGVDLSELSQDAVTVSPDGRALTLRLPPAEVFDVIPDNAGTRVYSRNRGWFAPQNQDLETLARQQADRQILASACEDGILAEATDQAETALRQFLGLLDDVQVTVIAAPPAACQPPGAAAATPLPTP